MSSLYEERALSLEEEALYTKVHTLVLPIGSTGKQLLLGGSCRIVEAMVKLKIDGTSTRLYTLENAVDD